MKRLLCLVVLSAFLSVTSASARDYSQMYPAETLQRVSEVYGKNIRDALYGEIKLQLLPAELRSLGRVDLQQPWDHTRDPFEFSANAGTGVVLIPALSVKFLDDLAIANAWFERKGCNKEAIFDYAAALDFSDHYLPSLLRALQVPDKAYELDPYVDDVSQKILKSAIAFILLHELGHIHHNHVRYRGFDPAKARLEEAQADQFALNVLRRMRLPPLGMAFWFTALSMRDPLVEGSPSQTHPLTAARMQAIADALREHPEDFIEPDNRGRWNADTIRGLAGEFDVLADNLRDPDLRRLVKLRGAKATPKLIASACDSEQHRQDWMDTFQSLFR